VLNGNLDVDTIHEGGFTIYLVEEPGTSVETDVLLFAIDGARGRGFFYRANK
jgi:hypothetical protein